MTQSVSTLPPVGRLPALAVALGAATWGIFWMPLRALADVGVPAAWAVAAFFLAPLLLVLPFSLHRWRKLREGGLNLAWTGVLTGGSFAMYSGALLLTEVVYALMLFYLTPVWSTLLERLRFGTPLTAVRMTTIVLGIAGLLVVLGVDHGLPMPRNIGDWMALVSGIIWAFAAVRLRTDVRNSSFEKSVCYFAAGGLLSVALAVLITPQAPGLSMEALLRLAPWFSLFVLLVLVPTTVTILWGAARLSPGLVGVLFMTEISVGTITAAIWSGEPFGLRELVGVVLITAAGIWEVLLGHRQSRR